MYFLKYLNWSFHFIFFFNCGWINYLNLYICTSSIQVFNKLLSLATSASHQKFMSCAWSNMLISTSGVSGSLDCDISYNKRGGSGSLDCDISYNKRGGSGPLDCDISYNKRGGSGSLDCDISYNKRGGSGSLDCDISYNKRGEVGLLIVI